MRMSAPLGHPVFPVRFPCPPAALATGKTVFATIRDGKGILFAKCPSVATRVGPISARPPTYTKNLVVSAVPQAKRAEIELRRKTPKHKNRNFKSVASAIFATSGCQYSHFTRRYRRRHGQRLLGIDDDIARRCRVTRHRRSPIRTKNSE